MRKEWVVLCGAVLLVICGCIYEVPLVEKAEIPVDPALVGTWQLIPPAGEEEEPEEKMTIRPLSSTEYEAICSPGNRDQMTFRAYSIGIGDMKLIQLEWLDAGSGENERFHVCRSSISDGILAVEMLNPEIVEPSSTDPTVLREMLLENGGNRELFGSSLRYRKLYD